MGSLSLSPWQQREVPARCLGSCFPSHCSPPALSSFSNHAPGSSAGTSQAQSLGLGSPHLVQGTMHPDFCETSFYSE